MAKPVDPSSGSAGDNSDRRPQPRDDSRITVELTFDASQDIERQIGELNLEKVDADRLRKLAGKSAALRKKLCQSEDRQGTRHLDSKLSSAARGCGDRMNSTRRTNHLERGTSPYLLQHAFNPVDWYPWGDKAFAKARSEEKPAL